MGKAFQTEGYNKNEIETIPKLLTRDTREETRSKRKGNRTISPLTNQAIYENNQNRLIKKWENIERE